MARRSLNTSHLLPPTRLRELARDWLREDTPSFDYGGYVVGENIETAVLICKSAGVLAGVSFFDAIFHELDCSVEWFVVEGAFINPICRVARVTGKARNLLLGERVALNCVTRASGVATLARRLRDVADKEKWHGEIAGTRKTTPGFRIVEKHALLVGGISTHRYDLSSMIMLKDNHIWASGSITQAVKAAKNVAGFSTKIEVECRSVAEAKEAASTGAHIVMLDNFHPKILHESSADIKAEFPHVLVEASGGITEDTITGFFGPHVDVISLSQTTQGYGVVDFSFKIVKEGHDPTNPIVSSSS